MLRSRLPVLLMAAIVPLDIEEGFSFPVKNAGFEDSPTVLTDWFTNSPGSWQPSSLEAYTGTQSARLIKTQAGETTFWSTQSVTASTPELHVPALPEHLGEKLACGIWFYVDAVTVHGSVTVRVKCNGSGGSLGVISESSYSTVDMPIDSWVYLPAVPAAVNQTLNGRVVAGTVSITTTIAVDAQGTFFADEVQAGRHEAVDYLVDNGSFEDGLTGWTKSGSVSVVTSSDEFNNEAYYGLSMLKFHRSFPALVATISQTLPLGSLPRDPRTNHTPEASAWIRYNSNVIPSVGTMDLRVFAKNQTGGKQLIGRGTHIPSQLDIDSGQWTLLQTDLVGTGEIPFQVAGSPTTEIEVKLLGSTYGTVHVDFLQIGEDWATNGNPHRYVIADIYLLHRAFTPAGVDPGYLGDDDSSVYGSDPSLWTDAQRNNMWKGWRSAWGVDSLTCYSPGDPPTDVDWITCMPTPAGAPAFFWNHDPVLLDQGCDRRGNLRRDVATSIDNPVSHPFSTAGADDLPLAGAYSSYDPDIILWQVKMAKAAGVDAFCLENLGWRLAERNWTYHPDYSPSSPPTPENNWDDLQVLDPRSPLQFVAMEEFYQLADTSDFKLLPYWTPEAHLGSTGGILGHATDADQEQGIIDDFIAYVEFFGRRKSALKVNGDFVIAVSHQNRLLMSGAPIPWDQILTAVEAGIDSDLSVTLWLNRIPEGTDFTTGSPPDSEFDGAVRWHPATPESGLLKYADFADFMNGVPLLSPLHNTQTTWEGVASSQATEQAFITEQWAAAGDDSRLPIGFVYTDFDNSGIAGRDGTLYSTTGVPLAPVCVRVVSEYIRDPALGEVNDTWLSRVFESNLNLGLDWALICTWNDWGEMTQFEPTWRFAYWDAITTGSKAPTVHPNSYLVAGEYEEVFGRLLDLQVELGAMKGLSVGTGSNDDLNPDDFHELSGQYLLEQANGTVREYD